MEEIIKLLTDELDKVIREIEVTENNIRVAKNKIDKLIGKRKSLQKAINKLSVKEV